MRKIEVQIRQRETCRDLPLPTYMSQHASGMDLFAAVEEETVLGPGARMRVPTGIFVAVPEGFEIQVRARSGLAMKHGIALVNGPGTIDADYRGEIGVLLINLGTEAFRIRRGDRIAQLVVTPVLQGEWVRVEELPESDRASGGFGHTGLSADETERRRS